MSEKRTQERLVYDTLAILVRARTEQIQIESMRQGVSCSPRYLRWMAERGIIRNIGKVAEGDRTDSWQVIAPYSPEVKKPLEQGDMFDDDLRMPE